MWQETTKYIFVELGFHHIGVNWMLVRYRCYDFAFKSIFPFLVNFRILSPNRIISEN